MPNSAIQWLDPKERPVTRDVIGKTICLRNENGVTTILKIVPLLTNGVMTEGWFSTITWLNESNYKYIILPE